MTLSLDSAGRFFQLVVHDRPPPAGFSFESPQALAGWLRRQEIAGFALDYCRRHFPAVAAELAAEAYLVVAENKLRFDRLEELLTLFAEEGLAVVLIKGAALAHSVYPHTAARSMSDIDLWFSPEGLPRAVDLLEARGYRVAEHDRRPLSLQEMAQGEVQLYHPDRAESLLELHWSVFPGWWFRYTTQIEHDALWRQRVPLRVGRADACQLAPEDAVIELAAHLVVNHQFGLTPLRSLLDIWLTLRQRPLDWERLAEQARRWRLAVCVWLALTMLDELVGLDGGARPALARLAPAPVRRRLLSRLVTPASVLAGRDLQASRLRYLFLLLVVDRFADQRHLVRQTFWPERRWLQARYGPGRSRLYHLRHLFTSREF